MKEGYWFRSTSFPIEPGEDKDTNPGIHGRQLALWLRTKLESAGQSVVDVIPEDFGWCVRCQVKPLQLWVGCGNVSDNEPSKATPNGEGLIWHCFPVAEAPLISRLFRKHDLEQELSRQDNLLRNILMSEPSITLVETH